jgi:hypothetical protein
MTKISRPTIRETYGTVFSAGKLRPVIVSIRPPNVIGFRLKGTRRTYYLTSDGLYVQAVRAELSAGKRERAKAHKGKMED